ncbi:hypothetical protein DNHGIG_02510 [Collibacillus ludicampi]|uniref:Uncharacterized protein n=1 Tax=Collibacillus ludicampi TaxID=2771369 RepID=A0AAV4LA95_9BACL|nr:hypothetical protein [Collibacillus ludicampi]GIM44702.1 hypothetical protein DNHGIG_02510 [Collibacillus ludicampi]
MYIKVTRQDIFNSFMISQLQGKKQDLLDMLAFSPDLAESEIAEINQLISLIDYRMEDINELMENVV